MCDVKHCIVFSDAYKVQLEASGNTQLIIDQTTRPKTTLDCSWKANNHADNNSKYIELAKPIKSCWIDDHELLQSFWNRSDCTTSNTSKTMVSFWASLFSFLMLCLNRQNHPQCLLFTQLQLRAAYYSKKNLLHHLFPNFIHRYCRQWITSFYKTRAVTAIKMRKCSSEWMLQAECLSFSFFPFFHCMGESISVWTKSSIGPAPYSPPNKQTA